MLAYDGRLDNDRFAFGYGIGTISDFNSHIFINPEIEWLQQVSADFNHYSTLRCNIGYKVGDNFEILAGPSLVWHFKINADDYHHNYSEWDPDLPEVNKIRVGYNLAIRYRL